MTGMPCQVQILKIEKDNFDFDLTSKEHTGEQRQIFCLAISAKRYALFLKDQNGNPVLLRKDINNKADHFSRHGLGHLLNPSDPESDDPAWIAHVWENIIRGALGLKKKNQPFEKVPAIGRVSVSSPAVMRSFEAINEGKPYPDQVKPFNFAISCHIRQLGHPVGVDAERFHLIAPHETDPRKWLKVDWLDQYTGKTFRITTMDFPTTRNTARVKTYGDVILEYEYHAEAKYADANSIPSDKQTIGLLQRRHVRIAYITRIGKESNSLEKVESGSVHSAQDVYTEYQPVDEWENVIVPALKKIPLSIQEKKTGLSRRMLIKTRLGQTRPHPRNQRLLASIVRELLHELA